MAVPSDALNSPILTQLSDDEIPIVKSIYDLRIYPARDPMTGKIVYDVPFTVSFVTEDGRFYLGEGLKDKQNLTLEEYRALLKRVPDEEIYPKVPPGGQLTIAPENLDENLDKTSTRIIRPDLGYYESDEDSEKIHALFLNETLTMERISKPPHPNIIKYHGCRVRDGRIIGLVVDELDTTLQALFIRHPSYKFDIDKFMTALESAADHLHSLGLAHNCINPCTVGIKDDMPVLAQLGACLPFQFQMERMVFSEGWFKDQERSSRSKKKHDTDCLLELRKWLEEKMDSDTLVVSEISEECVEREE